MRDTTESNKCTAAEACLALSETHPDSAYGSVPALDQNDALEAYRAHDDGVLDEFPQALTAYIDFHQRQWL